MLLLGIMGPGRAGKDEAADWFRNNCGLRYRGTTSTVISWEVAKREGISFEDAHAQRHHRRAYWRSLGDELRQEDPAALAREVLFESDILVGVRARIEMQQVLKEQLCDIVIWIDRSGIEVDPTIEFGPELCHIVIQNHWTLKEFHDRLEVFARAVNIFPRNK